MNTLSFYIKEVIYVNEKFVIKKVKQKKTIQVISIYYSIFKIINLSYIYIVYDYKYGDLTIIKS